MQNIEIDRIDLNLPGFLQQHGRASNLELADAVGLSTSQCHRRHRRLEEIGLITGYETRPDSTRLDAARLGLGAVAFVHVAMEKDPIASQRKFTDANLALSALQECFSVTGDFDYVLKVVAADLKALSRFLMNTLMVLPSVCLERLKSTGALPLPS